MRTVVLIGNPRAGGRTTTVGVSVAERVAETVGGSASDIAVIELADIAGELFDWSSEIVAGAVETVKSAQLLVVASPTYKGTYTGLLKAFLDRFATDDLNGVTAVPLLMGGSATHALAVEVHLRPLLVEIGASLPTRGLFIVDSEMDKLEPTIGRWLAEAAESLMHALS